MSVQKYPSTHPLLPLIAASVRDAFHILEDAMELAEGSSTKTTAEMTRTAVTEAVEITVKSLRIKQKINLS